MDILINIAIFIGVSFSFSLLFFFPCAIIRKSIWDLSVYEFLRGSDLAVEIPAMRKRAFSIIKWFMFIFSVLILVYFLFNFLFANAVAGLCGAAAFIIIAHLNGSEQDSRGDIEDFIKLHKSYLDDSLKEK